MINKVQAYISSHKLFTKESRILVGLSGGPDSMALIHLLIQLGYDCIAGHCNFHLRGDASDSDAKFVIKWCQKNNIPIFTKDFDTTAYASAKKISIEMAARELRYNWFDELRVQQNADVVGIAHHQDDSVETILINLVRGTGIKGLTGIPVVNGYIVRPLLSVSRQEIMAYCVENNLPYVIDHTNEEELYTRNVLRLNVLPTLEKINPSIKKSIQVTANNLAEVEKIYNGYIHTTIKKVLHHNTIDIKQLKKTYSPQSILFEILFPLGFTSAVIEDISMNLDAIPGKMYYAETYRLLKDRDFLIISNIQAELSDDKVYTIDKNAKDMDKSMPFGIKINTYEYNSDFKIQKDNAVLQCDMDKLTFPLTLRKWRKGDWFIPFGMNGRKKVSDFFSDNKFNMFQKEETWILLSNNEIVWIVNHRADNRFRITDATKYVCTIALYEENE